jgi:hypothetical protein
MKKRNLEIVLKEIHPSLDFDEEESINSALVLSKGVDWDGSKISAEGVKSHTERLRGLSLGLIVKLFDTLKTYSKDMFMEGVNNWGLKEDFIGEFNISRDYQGAADYVRKNFISGFEIVPARDKKLPKFRAYLSEYLLGGYSIHLRNLRLIGRSRKNHSTYGELLDLNLPSKRELAEHLFDQIDFHRSLKNHREKDEYIRDLRYFRSNFLVLDGNGATIKRMHIPSYFSSSTLGRVGDFRS